jgi:hypothetical protein
MEKLGSSSRFVVYAAKEAEHCPALTSRGMVAKDRISTAVEHVVESVNLGGLFRVLPMVNTF